MWCEMAWKSMQRMVVRVLVISILENIRNYLLAFALTLPHPHPVIPSVLSSWCDPTHTYIPSNPFQSVCITDTYYPSMDTYNYNQMHCYYYYYYHHTLLYQAPPYFAYKVIKLSQRAVHKRLLIA